MSAPDTSLPILAHPEVLPPGEASLATAYPGQWWHRAADSERIVCDLCPRACSLKAGDRGFCFVRENVAGQMVLSTYGRSTGFCIDPIEKKPLNHFYPGTSVLSFGTAGCNLGCKFCQNWSISKSREMESLSETATPEQIALAAQRMGARSVAFTYNDPVVWAEYAIDTARACRAAGVKTVAVTAGYITPAARPEFYRYMDAANVDLKAFSEQFYQHLTLSHLEPVLDTLKWLQHESDVWFEITNLVIPQENDSLDEVKRMSDWCYDNLGPDVPLHFTAFHPDFRLQNRPATPPETLIACHEIARERGLNYVYTGNVHDRSRQTTYCPQCRAAVIERDWYLLGGYRIQANACANCGHAIAGRFDNAPGNWGPRRQPVRIADFAPLTPQLTAGANKMIETNLPSTHAAAIANDAASQSVPLPTLTDEQERGIMETAAAVIVAAVTKQPLSVNEYFLRGLAEHPVFGTFVTARRHGHLRSCCGFLGQYVPLWQALQLAAGRTACDDPRFPPISPTELPYLDLDVWLLARSQPVTASGAERVSAVVIGRHGLQISRGSQSGLLLPGVAVEHGWDALQFLQQVCLKAGLPTTAWQDADVQLATFEGIAIEGELGRLASGVDALRPAAPIAREELVPLARHVGGNLVQLLQGTAGSAHAPELRDANVCGVVLVVEGVNVQQRMEARRLVPRPTLPLQATLFEFTQALAQAFAQRADLAKWFEKLRIGLSVLYDVAMHGTMDRLDLAGIDMRERALFLAEGPRQGLFFEPQRTPEQVVTEGVQLIGATNPAHTQVQSVAILTTETRVVYVSAPPPAEVPQPAPSTRSATQAGRFYPADPAQLAAQLDEFWQRDVPSPRKWRACMVPHAGLIYSGRIAADVLRQIEMPPSVLIIGPKHTPFGVEQALAPYQQWSIPGAELAADQGLTAALAQGIPSLFLDHAAHQQEHSIEVELPILARLAPQAKLAAIALGNLTWAECQTFATQLANVLRQLPEPPLLVISSDMNHFASDAEGRRLDRMALDALERLDPEHLFQVVTQHNISMCGLRPAVIVMEALRQLGQLHECRQVAYATSAEISGDTSRVVGYAGTLFN